MSNSRYPFEDITIPFENITIPFENITIPPSHTANEPPHAHNMQTTGPSTQFSTKWPQTTAMWPPIGTGMKTSDGSRGQSKPEPLFKNAFSSYKQGPDASSLDNPEAITGSGSLLSNSEQEHWSRPQWSSGNISAGLASARSNHTNASPVRQRTNQHTRSNSPFFSPQTAIGQTTGTRQSSSLLDPTTSSFQFSGIINPQPGQPVSQDHAINTSRRDFDHIQFGSTALPNGNAGFSGYTSSVASRSGSLPPSRHRLDDHGGSHIHSDMLGHHTNQHSRNSTYSTTNGYSRASDQIWQPKANDLSNMASRLDPNKNEVEVAGQYLWGNQAHHLQSPETINGAFNGYSNSRHGSISHDTGMQSNSIAQSNQHRMSFADRSSRSSTGSDARQSRGSPMYFGGNTPPVPDHSRTYSHSSNNQNRPVMQNQPLLDHKLRDVQLSRQPNYPQAPASPYRTQFGNMYDYSSQNPQALQRMNPHLNPQMNHQMNPQMNPTMNGQSNPQMAPYYAMQNLQAPYNSTPQFQRLPPKGPAIETMASDNLRSPLLEEFRSCKGTRRYELKDIYNYIVEFSGDQHGSRFIQQKLETANSDEKSQIFREILPNAVQLMTDVFGNYVIQKFFEHGNQQQKKQLGDKLKGHVAELSTQMYGCRVVQKAFEHVLLDQQKELVRELENQVLKCVKDQNGNHVIQKAIQWIPMDHITFIINAFANHVHQLSVHSYGCRVVQRILENCQGVSKAKILDELQTCVAQLLLDQYGNYVTQHTIEHGRPVDRAKIIDSIIDNFSVYSMHKYASNVVEKSIEYATPEERTRMVEVTTKVDDKGEPYLQHLMRDNFGNYVIQRLLKKLEPSDGVRSPEYQSFVNLTRSIIPKLRHQLYCSHGTLSKQLSMIERLITRPKADATEEDAGENSESVASESLSGANAKPNPPQIDTASTPPLINEDTQSPQSSSHPSTDNNSVDGRVVDVSMDDRKSQSSIPAQVAGDDDTITSDSTSTITAHVC